MQKQPAVGEKRLIAFVQKLRSINVEARTIEFVASTETVDRYGDIIRVAGWETRNYMRNPVFLWAHRSTDPPIGKTVKLFTESNPAALVQVVEFASKETYPFADTIFNLYRDGFMSSVSVGFKPMEKPKPIRDKDTDQITGFEFTKQELMELSAVPLPANPDALARAMTDEAKYSKDELDVIKRCGEMNAPWSNMVPGVTYIPSDLTKDTPVEAAAEAEEEMTHAATNGRERRAAAVAAGNGASKTSVSEVLAKLVETNASVEGLKTAMVKRAELGEALTRVDDVKSSVKVLTGAVRDLANGLATKDEVERMVPDFERLIVKLDKLHNLGAKEGSLGDIAATLQSLVKQLEKALSGILRKNDLQDLASRVEAGRGAVASLEEVVAKASDVRRFGEAIGEVRARVLEVARVIDIDTAKAAAVESIVVGLDTLGDRVGELRDKVAASVGAESTRVAVLQSAATTLEELRNAFDAAAGNTSAHASMLASVSTTVEMLRERFDLFRQDVSRDEDVKWLVDKHAEMNASIALLVTATRETKQLLGDVLERIENGCKRIDTLADHVAQVENTLTQRREAEAEERQAVCPYTDDVIAEKGTKWDAVAEMAKQSTASAWKHMSTVIFGDPSNKASYKLPHHSGSGFKVIPNGVRAALARVEQTQMAPSDRAGARAHLARHQKKIAAMKGFDFDAEAFDRHLDELGRVYRAADDRGDEQERVAADQMIARYVDKMCVLEEAAPPPTERVAPADPARTKLSSFLDTLKAKPTTRGDQTDDPADPTDDDNNEDDAPDTMCTSPKCACKGYRGDKDDVPTTPCKRSLPDGSKCGHPKNMHTGKSS